MPCLEDLDALGYLHPRLTPGALSFFPSFLLRLGRDSTSLALTVRGFFGAGIRHPPGPQTGCQERDESPNRGAEKNFQIGIENRRGARARARVEPGERNETPTRVGPKAGQRPLRKLFQTMLPQRYPATERIERLIVLSSHEVAHRQITGARLQTDQERQCC